MLPLYLLTTFLSAALLFAVQPMVGKLVLPALGGTPSVWNTCMVFFQGILLIGYGYAHLSRKLGFKAQSILHLGLQIGALFLLPIAIDATRLADASSAPIGPLLIALTVSVGFPFLVVSASAPLFQDWFGLTDHEDAGDPYHLYAASNAGSMLSLLAYPLVIEPNLDVVSQTVWWKYGFGALTVLTVGLVAFAWKRQARTHEDQKLSTEGVDPLTWKKRGYWVLAAFIPSSLLLGATTVLTTDIAAVPLFWVVPLALYLLTFILVFARKTLLPHDVMVRALPIIVVPFVVVLVMELNRPWWVMASFHLAFFFIAAMVFHGELARTRPKPVHLTEFYFWMSFGGVLGGAFNGLLAPVVFDAVWEYPLVILLAVVLLPAIPVDLSKRVKIDVAISIALLTVLVLLARGFVFENSDLGFAVIMLAASPAIARLIRPRLFEIGVVIALVMGHVAFAATYDAVFQERSFFATSRVVKSEEFKATFLLHGNTNHGAQSLMKGRERWVLPYHPPGAPLHQVYERVGEKWGADGDVAVVGLGVGGHACFSVPGQRLTFFEIDPVVEKIATDPELFDFMERCEGEYEIVMGDGRLMLARQPDETYELIVMDAFTSDAIPTHLVTIEALSEYVDKLQPEGALVLHISNRYLNLEPMIAAQIEELGLVGRIRRAPAADIEDASTSPSVVVIVARREEHLLGLDDAEKWRPLKRSEGVEPWTDTFSNIVSVYKWL